eukprot:COSAG01_NODE_39915_length_470_cov_1.115903_2_plen_51_part_01
MLMSTSAHPTHAKMEPRATTQHRQALLYSFLMCALVSQAMRTRQEIKTVAS